MVKRMHGPVFSFQNSLELSRAMLQPKNGELLDFLPFISLIPISNHPYPYQMFRFSILELPSYTPDFDIFFSVFSNSYLYKNKNCS
jgi:hypothetical protein